jgi:hypothetical protein
MTIIWNDVFMWASGFTVVAAAIFALQQLTKPLRKKATEMMVIWEQFLKDWAGEPAREGRDAVPGVMERLNNIDGELKRNGGKSVKDTVTRIEKRIIEGDKKFNDLYSRVEDLEKKVGH